MEKAHELIFWLTVALCFALTGCAAKAESDSFHIVIATNPPEADVTVCNETTGHCVSNAKTPFKLVLSRSQDITWPTRYTILVTKEGFVDVSRTLHFGVDGWYLLITDKANSETLEVREVDGYRIELQLQKSEPVDLPPGDSLARMSPGW